MAFMVRNQNDFFKYLNSTIKPRIKYSLQQSAEDVEQMVRDYLMETLYSTSPSEYERTYELVNSVTHTNVEQVGDVFYVKIYYDTDKIKPHILEHKWNQHATFWGVDMSEYLPLWIEKGTEGNPYYQHEDYRVIETVAGWTTLITKKIREHLKNNGLNVKIRR